ncbi:hypothetical protein Bca4012_005110 [Brassica carinata]
MDNKSATTVEADPAVIEKKTSDVMQILQGLADRLQKIEERMDSCLQKMEEKIDLLISSISVKAEADNMSIDQFYFGQESDERGVMIVFYMVPVVHGQETFDRFGRVSGGPGRGQETDNHFGPFFNGRGRGLNVGGPFAGGRCGGQGFCGYC